MPELQSGDIILGRYRILHKIGQGGFGEVYLAMHLQQKTPLALKVIRQDAPGMGSRVFAESRERFEIEARLGEKLSHPNIVRAFDFGREGEHYYLATDYAAGGSLLDRMANHPLPVEQVIQIALDLARGLAAIHNLDVVHRDLKPANILFNAQGIAQIADLGLAQLPGGVSMRSFLSSDMPGSTHPGTRAYMSPEQEITSGYLKPASDVYSLGVVIFEMLSGRNVKNLPPGVAISTFCPDVPAWFADLLGCMLAHSPEDRPWDGQEVLLELQKGIQGPASVSPGARPQQAQPDASGFGRADTRPQPRWLFLLIPFALLVIGIGLAFLLSNPPDSLPEKQASETSGGAVQPAGESDLVIEYLVSSANSMLQSLDGVPKIQMVHQGLADLWADWADADPGLGVALRVFGSQYSAVDRANSCLDTRSLSAPVTFPAGFADLLNSAEARGLTPLAEALYAALGDFHPNQRKVIVLVTDSGDTCGQDPCTWAVTQYRDAGLVMPIYVLDLGGDSKLACLATESNGQYFSIKNSAELQQALQRIREGNLP